MRQLLDPLLGARIEDGWEGVGAVGFELAWHHSNDYFATTGHQCQPDYRKVQPHACMIQIRGPKGHAMVLSSLPGITS